MKRLAIYDAAARFEQGANVFGVSVANTDLFRALARHAGLEQLDVLAHGPVDEAGLNRDLRGDVAHAARVQPGLITDQSLAARAGTVVRGGPRLDALSWVRRRAVGDRGYSLIGLIHTIAPPAMRQEIAMAAVGPVQPWDALVCTSPSIQSAMGQMFDEWADYLGERIGGEKRIRPMLPLVPLGVNGDVFASAADRPSVRKARREQLGAAEGDIIILWVGRLSFFEKAFPQAMFKAAQQASAQTGVKVHFAMVGWFPGGKEDEARYRQAAGAYAPDVVVHFLDGNEKSLVNEMWAASDVFISLVDNIQETFGITPLEAMAAGLPVVVSDWDGYRYTVRDGIEGFLTPTLGAPAQNLLQDTAVSHALAVTSYQSYVGTVAQHTAVHIGRAAEALAALIRSPELRRDMGAAGRRRIAETFDWRVVAPQYRHLAQELMDIRTAEADGTRGLSNPVKGDPYRDFAGFPTRVLGLDDLMWLRPGSGEADLAAAEGVDLEQFAALRRASPAESRKVLELLPAGLARTVRTILLSFPTERRRHVLLGLMWMAKAGILDWRPEEGKST